MISSFFEGNWEGAEGGGSEPIVCCSFVWCCGVAPILLVWITLGLEATYEFLRTLALKRKK
jgi:hypothetical protein